MSFGLRIENLSGTLVFDAEASGHTYRGTATLVTSQSSDIVNLYPWVFEWIAPDTATVPVFAVNVDSSSVMCPLSYAQSGTRWTFQLFCVGLAGCEAQSTLTNVAPTVHVFAPGAQSGSHGLRIFRADGSVSYDLQRAPLFPREVASFPSRLGFKMGSAPGSGAWDSFRQGDQQAIASNFASLAVLGCCAGALETEVTSISEPDITYHYGWCRGAGVLRRVRFWATDQDLFGSSASESDPRMGRSLNLGACFAVILDASILT